MVWARRCWIRLQGLLLRGRNAQQLHDEMQFHLEQQIAENLGAGMSRDEARYAAMRTFGNPTVLKEEARDTWGWIAVEEIAKDLRYALRMLGKNFGFSAVAVVTLALGIGANAAIFTVINAVMLRALPVKHPGELVTVGNPARVHSWGTGTPRTDVFSYPLYRELRDNNRVFSSLLASKEGGKYPVVVSKFAIKGIGEYIRPRRSRAPGMNAGGIAHGYKLPWVLYGQGAQHDRINHGKNGGVRADAQRQCDHGHGAEAEVLAQHAQPITQVLGDFFNRDPAPSVARFFLEYRRVAKSAHGGVARFIAAHTGAEVFSDLLFEMKLHFVMQLLRIPAAKKQTLQADPASPSPHHDITTLRCFDDQIDRRRQTTPVCSFLFELRAPSNC